MNFCPGELILKLLAHIGEWHQNLSEKTAIKSLDPLLIIQMSALQEVLNLIEIHL